MVVTFIVNVANLSSKTTLATDRGNLLSLRVVLKCVCGRVVGSTDEVFLTK